MIRNAIFMFMGSVVACTVAWADVPQTINHQGVVTVNGVRFPGPTGQFKFAILDGSGINVWTNDNSNLVMGGVPNTHEDVPVQDGIYSVLLGGSDGENYTMTPIPPSIFAMSGTKLRIFFNDGVIGFQALTPDHPLAASPYAHRSAQSDFQPPIGSIIAWHKDFANTPALPNGWIECNGQTLADSDSPYNGQTVPNLNSAAPLAGGRFLRGGTASGIMQDATGVCTTTFPGAVEAIGFGSSVFAPDSDHDGLVPNTTLNRVSLQDTRTTFAQFSRVRPVNMSVVWIMRVK